MKIVFFGDSVTEARRNLLDASDLGEGYVKIAEGKLRLLYPALPLEVLNRGVGGDRTEQLLARIQKDVVCEHPDVVIMQVGINDVWHRFLIGVEVTPEEFSIRYHELVRTIKETGAQLLLLQPFALDVGGMSELRPCLDRFNGIIREIANVENVPLIPMDEIFTERTQDIAPEQFAADGVHPSLLGCSEIADQVIGELKKYIG